MYQTWQAIDPETTWGDFEPGAVLFYTDEEAIVFDVRKESSKLKVRIQKTDGEQFTKEVKESSGMGKVARDEFSGSTAELRAVVLPAVLWKEDGLWAPRNLVGLAASLAVLMAGIGLIVWLDTYAFMWMIVMGAAAAGMGARRVFRGGRLSFLAPERLGLTMDNIHAYALTREQGRLWVPPTRGADRRALAFERVGAIRADYLERREDIAYRIESSALFDPAVPATAAFEAALVAFDDVRDDTPLDDVDALASEVELTFNTAQANAERLGFSHLPEEARDGARRAGKAARLAAGATTEGERVASLNHAKRILDSLAIYYLPTLDERLAIEAPRR
ncbi:MAG TPA: hypothetical protein K8V15_05780 [Tessaracoccus flavescens]|uniref:Uncharacterized protein n=1 Tax=Tessaracoccus flavescens TaxID=399497 RepID=A0A921EPP0_9ACTN|nr:hypothetical protein [Tessaracoccus flavescens]